MKAKSLSLPRAFLASVFSARPTNPGKEHRLLLMIPVNVNLPKISSLCHHSSQVISMFRI
jgi:hypothetical protein